MCSYTIEPAFYYIFFSFFQPSPNAILLLIDRDSFCAMQFPENESLVVEEFVSVQMVQSLFCRIDSDGIRLDMEVVYNKIAPPLLKLVAYICFKSHPFLR